LLKKPGRQLDVILSEAKNLDFPALFQRLHRGSIPDARVKAREVYIGFAKDLVPDMLT